MVRAETDSIYLTNGGMGRATLSIQIYSKTGINITIFYLYIALFKVKKSIIHRNQWLKLRDIIDQGKYGIPQLNGLRIERGRSPTDVIKENFC